MGVYFVSAQSYMRPLHIKRGKPLLFKDNALKIAELGIPVFPTINKKPCSNEKVDIDGEMKGGFYTATTDEQRINEWIEKHPEAEVSVALSKEFMVLDFDCSEQQKDRARQMEVGAVMEEYPIGLVQFMESILEGRDFIEKALDNIVPSNTGKHLYIKTHGSLSHDMRMEGLEKVETLDPYNKPIRLYEGSVEALTNPIEIPNTIAREMISRIGGSNTQNENKNVTGGKQAGNKKEEILEKVFSIRDNFYDEITKKGAEGFETKFTYKKGDITETLLFHPGVNVIVAQTGDGKSTMSGTLAHRWCVKGDKKGVYVSLEETLQGAARRLLLANDKVYEAMKDVQRELVEQGYDESLQKSLLTIMRGRSSPHLQSEKKVREILQEIHTEISQNILFVPFSLDIETLVHVLRGIIEKEQVDVVFLDYAQIIRGAGGNTEQLRMKEIMGTLMEVSKEMDTVFIVSAQANRTAGTKRDIKDTDRIREADDIGQAAEMVVALNRNSFRVLKNRIDGSTGTGWMKVGERGLFVPTTYKEYKESRKNEKEEEEVLNSI